MKYESKWHIVVSVAPTSMNTSGVPSLPQNHSKRTPKQEHPYPL